mmetsp:Transcript_19804/g.22117  ORF Transcript_19804/g.22117 Transcript_19804/m.22117 type:complete len:102 (+) Transcript_19804:383-688(+)
MGSLLNDELFSDITLILDDGVEIKAHKAVLASRCEVFKVMLTSQMQEGQKNSIEIKDTQSDVFKAIISFIYTDQAEFEDLNMVVNLLIESSKYGLVRLKKI